MAVPMGFAVLSLAHWYNGLPFAASCRDEPGARLVAIAHEDAAQGEPVAREVGVDFTTDYRALLARSDVDAVGIYASTDRVAEMSIAAAEAGKHMVVIKPMAMNLEEADRVVAAVRAAQVRYLPAESAYRLFESVRQMKQWIDEGRIGEPLNVFFAGRAGLPRRWRDDPARGWWTDPGRTVGGGWIDHGIYHVDFLRYLLASEFTSVRGFTANLKYVDLGRLEDYGIATFTTRRGAAVTIEDTWTQPGRGMQQLYQIVGTEGVIMVDATAQAMWLLGKFGPLQDRWVSVAPAPGRPSLAYHLVQCLNGDHPTVASVEDARTNLQVCLAFYRAAVAGSPVRLDAPTS